MLRRLTACVLDPYKYFVSMRCPLLQSSRCCMSASSSAAPHQPSRLRSPSPSSSPSEVAPSQSDIPAFEDLIRAGGPGIPKSESIIGFFVTPHRIYTLSCEGTELFAYVFTNQEVSAWSHTRGEREGSQLSRIFYRPETRIPSSFAGCIEYARRDHNATSITFNTGVRHTIPNSPSGDSYIDWLSTISASLRGPEPRDAENASV